jgi:ribosomal protein S18 acetylase RimI-like enzyme
MPESRLRAANTTDLAEIETLIDAAYSPWIATIGAKPGPMSDDYARAIAQGFVQVLDGASGIEAVLVLIPLPDAMLLDNVAVLPTAQGKGHGSRLLKAAEMAARSEGYRLVRLYTHEKMVANIGLYHRHGYDISKRVKERGLNRVYMEKTIRPHT